MNLPLHTGHPTYYLVRRMIRLSHAMSKVIIHEYRQMEFLRRLSYHLTATVSGKQSLLP